MFTLKLFLDSTLDTKSMNAVSVLPEATWVQGQTKTRRITGERRIRIRGVTVYANKKFRIQSIRIQRFHFGFRIHVLAVRKHQNESGAKTFRIRHKSRNFCSSVNVVSGTESQLVSGI